MRSFVRIKLRAPTKEYKPKMTYKLVNKETLSGDSGGTSVLLKADDEGNIEYKSDAEPEIGWCIRVGSAYARTMQTQDWWQTSYIKEILSREDNNNEIRIVFLTESGSIYTWSQFK